MGTGRFADRVVFLTGAGSGIGRATARRFASEGARVFGVDVVEAGLKETIDLIRGAGGEPEGIVCDVSRPAPVKAAIDAAVRAFGGLDVLVNAAGIGRAARLEEIDETEWSRVLAVNLTGPFLTTRYAIEHLLKRPGGNIVNVASIAGLRGQAYNSHYCASKAGLLNFTRSVAAEFATRGLRANCVCPGGVNTPLIQHFLPREDFELHLIQYYSPPVPNQFFEPEDIAVAITFLASDEARMINGIGLVSDAGTLA